MLSFFWRNITVVLGLTLAFAVMAVAFCGCCKTCPPPKTEIVTRLVEHSCELPPKPVLPVATLTEDCPTGKVCYSFEQAKNILRRDMAMRDWIEQVLIRCAKP
jgi:hypothetical protein